MKITNEDNCFLYLCFMEPVIYKILSPTNRVYIGQTVNFKIRLQHYKRLDCRKQIKLYNSFNKYGFDNHIIQIIHVCNERELNDLERYYQDLYCSTSRYGLNIRLTKSKDRSGKFSEATRKKMSEAKKGTKRSAEVRESISKAMKVLASKRDPSYYDNLKKCNLGRKHTKEHRRKNSESKLGNTFKRGKTKLKSQDNE